MRRKISSRRDSAATTADANVIDVPEFDFGNRLRAMTRWGADEARIIYLSKHARNKSTNWALWLTIFGSLCFFAASLVGLFALVNIFIGAPS
ncbi:hypothetical protein [Martelella radicis]|uniref:Uncharacterized protein n=1 Tax=Martelella radicis TaxID=1397476 RepID=A0A7W6KQ98_9HYPH|nr:hypothetical protein [Martelella radicis]MBB4124100.1 hypothetical protein [Martelella radicis]